MNQKSNIVKNTTVLFSGNLLAQLIMVSTIPIITRLYGPENFGVFAIFQTLCSIFISISCLRYNAAILLPRKDEDSNAVSILCLVIVSALSVILFGVFVIFSNEIGVLLKIETSKYLLLFVPLGVFLGGLFQTLSTRALRAKKNKTLAACRISTATATRLVNFLAWFSGITGVFGLVLGYIAGQASAIFSVSGFIFQIRESIIRQCRLPILKKILLRYVEFPKYFLSSLMEVVTRELPVILIAFFFTPEIVGFYALAWRIIGQPINLLGDAVARSYFQVATEKNRNNQDLSDITFNLIFYASALIAFPLLILAVLADEIVTIVFGQQWYATGLYIKLLVPMFVVNFSFRPVSVVFDIRETQKDRFLMCAILLTAAFVSLSIGGMFRISGLGVGLFAIGTAVIRLIYIKNLLTLIGVKINHLAVRLLHLGFNLIIFLLPVIVLKILFPEQKLFVSLIGIASIPFYFGYMYLTEPVLKKKLSVFFST